MRPDHASAPNSHNVQLGHIVTPGNGEPRRPVPLAARHEAGRSPGPRLIHTFATNLRGPAEPLTFASAPVQAVIPIPNTTGNVTVTFGALSYAGTLRITVGSDPSRMPDVAVLAAGHIRQII